MKASDLMIGDWVLYENKPTGVSEISYYNDDDPTICVWGTNYVADEKEIAPIPLTDEILEKNGFVDVGQQVLQYEDGLYWVWYELDTHRLGIDANNNSWDGESTTPMLRVVIFDVHQLQHALHLCGIDKEIVL